MLRYYTFALILVLLGTAGETSACNLRILPTSQPKEDTEENRARFVKRWMQDADKELTAPIANSIARKKLTIYEASKMWRPNAPEFIRLRQKLRDAESCGSEEATEKLALLDQLIGPDEKSKGQENAPRKSDVEEAMNLYMKYGNIAPSVTNCDRSGCSLMGLARMYIRVENTSCTLISENLAECTFRFKPLGEFGSSSPLVPLMDGIAASAEYRNAEATLKKESSGWVIPLGQLATYK